MNATASLHDLGQSIWIDNITRDMLASGKLAEYVQRSHVTGLTSNPTIFDNALKSSTSYDEQIRTCLRRGLTGEELFFELAIADLTKAADLFRPIHDRTRGLDGYVSLEVSPLLAYDTAATIAAAKKLHAQANRPNVFIKIPGTPEGLPAIEEAIFAGIPINVTLLFSKKQYLAAAQAYQRGIERRIRERLPADVRSVASLFVSRWDVATSAKLAPPLRNRLGIAVCHDAYAAYHDLLTSPNLLRVMNFGAQPQRLLFASTGTKDPSESDVLYVAALAAPYTINTMPDKTLDAFVEQGRLGEALRPDKKSAEKSLQEFVAAGIDLDRLAEQLQREGAEAFVKSWKALLERLATKAATLR